MDVIGATLPGTPFVVLGRTPDVAWGFTNTGPDVQDLYLEQIDPKDPKRYRTPAPAGQEAWATFTERVETFKVKGEPDVTHTVRPGGVAAAQSGPRRRAPAAPRSAGVVRAEQ